MSKQTTHKALLAQQLLSALLFTAVIVMLGWLSVRHDFQIDWTANNINTLTDGSRKQLSAMPDPVRFMAFSNQGGGEREAVRAVVAKYQRFKPDIELQFIDPSEQPQLVSEYQIRYAGQVVVEYQGRREILDGISEPAITGALQRLTYASEQWVVFLQGHGERASVSQGQQDYGQFAQTLRDKGLKVQDLNLFQSPRIPDNASLLVIASPQKALLDGEVQLIQDYLERGGNLLWLADPETPTGLDRVAQGLGIHWQNGFAVFPEYQLLGTGHPGVFAAVSYPRTPITQAMTQVTLFPLVRSLEVEAGSSWTAQPFLQSSATAWLETSALDGNAVSMDPAAGDIPGPLTIGMMLMRPAPTGDEATPHQQRVALVGDADFLSDAYLMQLGNEQLGLNLVQWLASRDSQIDVVVPEAADTDLYLSNTALVALTLGFVIVLPLLLIGVGAGRWILRRRR